ncbi:MAG: hypothetical protein ACTHNK_19705 [Thermomicrobiales bacterium]
MQATQPAPTFTGSDDERQLAEQIYDLARFQGRFFAATAPIRLKRDELVGFLGSQKGYKRLSTTTLAERVDTALAANPAVFAREETDDGAVTFLTTRAGTAPAARVEDQLHTLAERFATPVAAPPPPPKKEAPRIADAWSHPLVLDGLEEEGEPDGAGAVTTPVEPAEVAPAATVETEPAAPEAVAEPAVPEPAAVPAVPSLDTVPADVLRAVLAAQLESDDRFVQFGDRYYAEEFVDRYSRGDLRRIREYILEVMEPVSDATLLQELFGRRPNDPVFEAACFSINYRLSREKREFEFVGTRDSRLWATRGLAPFGTTLRKASELGQDFRLLHDEPAEEATDTVTHVLSFYEWVYGVLPLDGATRNLFPQPYLEDQKTAVLRFDVPQLYATFLAELRYPTGNRGGYLVGFDEFYREQLVPGAVFTIERTPGNDGHFALRFATASAREERLLQIDERRNRFVYRPQSFAVQVDDTWLLEESRYPRLANTKPLDDRERRRPEQVIGAAFERAAENLGTKNEPRYWSAPEELLPIVNLERPFSLRALREVLESPQFPQFTADSDTPGAFFYEPPAKAAKEPAPKKRGKVVEEDEDDEDYSG